MAQSSERWKAPAKPRARIPVAVTCERGRDRVRLAVSTSAAAGVLPGGSADRAADACTVP